MFALSRTWTTSLRFWAFLAGLGVIITFPLGMLRSGPTGPEPSVPANKRADDSVTVLLEPAKNPAVLTLLPDEHKVVGWISGPANRVGAVTQVRLRRQNRRSENRARQLFHLESPTSEEYSGHILHRRLDANRRRSHSRRRCRRACFSSSIAPPIGPTKNFSLPPFSAHSIPRASLSPCRCRRLKYISPLSTKIPR